MFDYFYDPLVVVVGAGLCCACIPVEWCRRRAKASTGFRHGCVRAYDLREVFLMNCFH